MKKHNLLHVVFGLMSGGVEQMLLNYFSSDEFKEFNLFIAYFGDPDIRCLNEFEKCGFTIIRLQNKTKKRFRFYNEIKTVLKQYNIDIVHSSLNIENYLVMKAAYDCGVPIRISHSHGLPEPSKSKLKNQLRKIKLLIGNRYSNYNLACSTKAGNYLFRKNKYTIIYNAIDIENFKFNYRIRSAIRNELGIDKQILIGYIARFNTGKNQEFIIEIMKDLVLLNDNIKVVLIGAGPLKDNIIKMINENDLEDYFIVLDSKQNIYDYYQTMDLFVFPSLEEGLGMVAIEAQINGLYTICSNGVPIDTKISNNISYLELNKELWIKEINDNLVIRDNENSFKCDCENYNIFVQRKRLYDIYIGALENETNNN